MQEFKIIDSSGDQLIVRDLEDQDDGYKTLTFGIALGEELEVNVELQLDDVRRLEHWLKLKREEMERHNEAALAKLDQRQGG